VRNTTVYQRPFEVRDGRGRGRGCGTPGTSSAARSGTRGWTSCRSARLRNIERALNELWEAPEARTPLQQLRDRIAIIVVTPLCLLAAGTLGTFSQLIDLVRRSRRRSA
jgi:hypothetical protein